MNSVYIVTYGLFMILEIKSNDQKEAQNRIRTWLDLMNNNECVERIWALLQKESYYNW